MVLGLIRCSPHYLPMLLSRRRCLIWTFWLSTYRSVVFVSESDRRRSISVRVRFLQDDIIWDMSFYDVIGVAGFERKLGEHFKNRFMVGFCG